MGQGRQSVRKRQQEEEQEEGFKVIPREQRGQLRKAVGIGCFKRPKNTVQLCTALGPEAKAGCLAVGGGGDVAGVGEEGQRGCQHPQELYRAHKTEQAPAVPCTQPDTRVPWVVPAQPRAGE